jgi:hypothetical protein
MSALTLEKCEKGIGMPSREWAGKCYQISCMIVDAGLIKGDPVYGHFRGAIHPHSYFGIRASMPFVQHGWIILPGGANVLDPTRFAFEDKDPCLYWGPNDSDYDEGGNRWRMSQRKPLPEHFPGEKIKRIDLLADLRAPVRSHLMAILNLTGKEARTPIPSSWVMWLANLSYDELRPFNLEIYATMKALGCEAFVPIDNFRRAERERA